MKKYIFSFIFIFIIFLFTNVYATESYTEVEYLESTGSQYIDTGVIFDSNSKIVIEFEKTGSSIDYERLFCVSNSDTDFIRVGTSNSFNYRINRSDKASVTINADTKYTIELTNYYLKLNDVTNSFTATTFSSSSNFELFRGKDRFGIFKIYSFKIYNSDVLVRDLIPALDSNNIACFYDNVEDEFLYNQGSGNFSVGNIVENNNNNNENSENIENNIIVDDDISVKDIAENIHTVLSVLTFVIIIIFMYRYLKSIFKRRS